MDEKHKNEDKKCYVLMLSRYFPKTHPRAGESTCLLESIEKGSKIHTIRGNYKLWEKRLAEVNAGEAYLSRRYWSKSPYNYLNDGSKQIEFDRIYKAGIQTFFIDKYIPNLYAWQIEHKKTGCHLWDVAANDGLSYEDFTSWLFQSKRKEFSGAIIHFTDFRY